MIQDSPHDGIDDLLDGPRAGVKGWIGRENGSTCQDEQFKVFNVNQVQRGFTRDEDEFLFLLQHDVRGAEQHVFTGAMRDPANSAHGAGDDDHGVGRVGTAGKGCVHALEAVRGCAEGQSQPIRQLLADDRLGVLALHYMKFVLAGIQVIEQALSIERAAGASYSDEYSQRVNRVTDDRNYGEVSYIQQAPLRLR